MPGKLLHVLHVSFFFVVVVLLGQSVIIFNYGANHSVSVLKYLITCWKTRT